MRVTTIRLWRNRSKRNDAWWEVPIGRRLFTADFAHSSHSHQFMLAVIEYPLWVIESCVYNRLSFLINNNNQQVEWKSILVSPKIHPNQSHACNQHAKQMKLQILFLWNKFFFRRFWLAVNSTHTEKNTEECVLSDENIIILITKIPKQTETTFLYWE